MINELIEQIGGRARLEQIKKSASSDANETVTMARALLAVLGQGCLHHWISSEGRTDSGWLCSKCGDYDGPPAASVPDRWIKCSDRMPVQKQSNRYIPMNLLLNERTVAQGGFDDGEFWIDGLVVNNVTRWSPLPAAPAPGGEK